MNFRPEEADAHRGQLPPLEYDSRMATTGRESSIGPVVSPNTRQNSNGAALNEQRQLTAASQTPQNTRTSLSKSLNEVLIRTSKWSSVEASQTPPLHSDHSSPVVNARRTPPPLTLNDPPRRDQRGPVATQALKSQTRLSYPQRQKLLDACASGMPVKQIAERFGVHRTTITRIASRSGVTMRNRPSPAPRSQPTSLLEAVEHLDPGIRLVDRVLK